MHIGAIFRERRVQRAKRIALRYRDSGPDARSTVFRMRCSICSRRLRNASRPSATPPSIDSSGAKCPFTNTSCAAAHAFDAPRARSRLGSALSRSPAGTASAPCAATLVNRQSSSCVVGNPSRRSAQTHLRAACAATAALCPGAVLRELSKVLQLALELFHRSLTAVSPHVARIRHGLPRFRLRSSRSPSLPAPAPVPDRPSARSARPPARARSPARCNSAAADSA